MLQEYYLVLKARQATALPGEVGSEIEVEGGFRLHDVLQITTIISVFFWPRLFFFGQCSLQILNFIIKTLIFLALQLQKPLRNKGFFFNSLRRKEIEIFGFARAFFKALNL